MRGVLASWLCLWLAACAVQEPDEPEADVRVLASGLQCGSTDRASIAEIGSSQELSARLPDRSPAEPPVAFDRERIFIISMGQQPTAGYSLGLARPRAGIDHAIATLLLDWQTPAPGAFTAQVITRPCLVITLEKRRYAGVRVVDQNGVERARLVLPAA